MLHQLHQVSLIAPDAPCNIKLHHIAPNNVGAVAKVIHFSGVEIHARISKLHVGENKV